MDSLNDRQLWSKSHLAAVTMPSVLELIYSCLSFIICLMHPALINVLHDLVTLEFISKMVKNNNWCFVLVT